MQYVCILGRQPALGMAELESRFGAQSIEIVQSGICILNTDHEINFDHFGGILKVAKLLTILSHIDWSKSVRYVVSTLPQHLQYIPEGKINLGVSLYDLKVPVSQINAGALSFKTSIKKAGRNARVVPNKEAELNTAQVIHNKLTGPTGLELLFVKSTDTTLLAQTIWVQDIDAYRRRDQERPMRDARVGMLPPKLAQIIINLAAGLHHPFSATSDGSLNYNEASESSVLLDPFCGTGVILQEALLQGWKVIGSDLDPRMVEYAQKNLEWLQKNYSQKNNNTKSKLTLNYEVIQADATSSTWQKPFQTIACETYLGRPFSSQPDPQTLQQVMHDVNVINKKFLQNLAQQTQSGFRVCLALPAWKIKGGFRRLQILDHLEELGYNSVRFTHAEAADLIYHREGQFVGRELVVLIRK